MSESKGALIAKTVQKHAGRAKEKLLQNLGKVDRTLDDIFEEHLQNFNRQHQQATRLQKEFNNYIRCVRAVQTASKSLMEAITEVYESGWSGHDLLYVQSQNLEVLWQDFSHKLGDQVLIPLNTYTNQFPETRKKIEKRGRKLVDYDSQRHSFQNLQANAAKRRDDVKVTRGREQLEEAKRTYEVLNSELHDELPALHDSRVLFHVTNLQTLFAAEQLFHSESAKVFNELEMISDKLATECQRGAYNKRSLSNNVSHNNVSAHNTLQRHNGADPPATATLQTPNTPPTPTSPAASAGGRFDTHVDTFAKVQPDTKVPPETPTESPRNTPEPAARKTDILKQTETIEKSPELPINNKNEEVVISNAEIIVTPPMNGHKHDSPVADKKESPKIEKKSEEKVVDEGKTVDEEIKKVENDTSEAALDDERPQVYDVPVGATVAAGVTGVTGALYRVRATYRYVREDDDELSFDVGDLISVVNYDDPDEQEEGWLMGIKDGTNEKGMFPANFTRRI